MLREHDPAALNAFGFYTRDRDLLEELIWKLNQAPNLDEQMRSVAQSVLTRIPDLIYELHVTARYAMGTAGLTGRLDQQRWWVPHDISAPPSRELIADQLDFTSTDVSRVLSDL